MGPISGKFPDSRDSFIHKSYFGVKRKKPPSWCGSDEEQAESASSSKQKVDT